MTERVEELICRKRGRGALALAIGTVALIGSGLAHAQVHGAVQYPPASVGEDAQPLPPARMVPQSVSPRRSELGISGSSQPPASYHPLTQPATRLGLPPTPDLGGRGD
jgi:hypothetical protein